MYYGDYEPTSPAFQYIGSVSLAYMERYCFAWQEI